MPQQSGPRLYKLSRDERRKNPPTPEELRLGHVMSRFSMFLRQGKFKEADELIASQTLRDQEQISEVCQEKKRDAMNETMSYGRVVLAGERKALQRAEGERGRKLTEKETQAWVS